MSGGRPPTYSPELLQKANDYVNGGYEVSEEAIPTVAGLAILLGVSRECIYLWGREHKAFLDILNHCQAKQELVLVSKGLNGKFNSPITKLLLTKHGYTDAVSQTIEGGKQPIKVDLTLSPEEAYRRMLDGN